MIRRIVRAALAVVFGHGVNIAGNLLLVPLFLGAWSTSVYGEWLTLSSAVAYLGTLDLGIQTYAVNRLTQAYQAKHFDEYRELQHAAIRFYLLLGIAGVVLTFVLSCIFPLRVWLRLDHTNIWEARIVVTLLAAQVLASLPANFVSSFYQTTGNLARSEWIYQIQRAAVMVSAAIALVFKPSMAVVAFVQFVPIVASTAAVVLHTHRRFAHLRFGISKAASTQTRAMLGPSSLFGLIALAQVVTLQGSTLLIASHLGATFVALYVTSRTLANMARQFLGLLSSASWTEFTLLESTGNRSGLQLAFHVLLAIGGCGCIAIGSSLWFEGGSVIEVWTRGKLLPDILVLRLLLLQVVLGVPWIAASTITATTNRHGTLARSYVVSSMIGIGLAAAGIGRAGLAAVPIGLIVGEAIGSYHFVVRDACGVVLESYGALAPRVWVGLLVTSMSTGLVAWQIHSLTASWNVVSRWVASGTCTALLAGAFSWLLWLSQDDRALLRNHFARRLASRSRGSLGTSQVP